MQLTDLASLGVMATCVSYALGSLTRYLIVRSALRDTTPEQRPEILEALPPLLAPPRVTPPRTSRALKPRKSISSVSQRGSLPCRDSSQDDSC